MNISLREEEIGVVLGVEVRHTPPVAHDLDRRAQPRRDERAIGLGERATDERGARGGGESGEPRQYPGGEYGPFADRLAHAAPFPSPPSPVCPVRSDRSQRSTRRTER